MFEHLSGFRKVIVAGAHRSGTTVATKMVAHDTGLAHVDERDYGDNNGDRFWSEILSPKRAAVHCVNFVHWLERDEIADAEDVAVLWIMRDINEILRSRHRLGWIQKQWRLYGNWKYGLACLPRCEQLLWSHYLKDRIRHSYEIEYRELAGHPLWLPDEARQGLRVKQTAL